MQDLFQVHHKTGLMVYLSSFGYRLKLCICFSSSEETCGQAATCSGPETSGKHCQKGKACLIYFIIDKEMYCAEKYQSINFCFNLTYLKFSLLLNFN